MQKVLRIDCSLPLELITPEFYRKIQELAPFGMGNPEPTFVSNVVIQDVKTVGKEKQHLKLHIVQQQLAISHKPLASFDAIGFKLGYKALQLKPGDKAKIVYSIEENEWQGKVSLQLKVKDIKS